MAGSNFDLLEQTMMDVVTNQFGYGASWSPSGGGPAQTGMVLFSSPTKKQQVQTLDFVGDTNYFMEYRKGVFTGLKEAVDDTKKKEQVVIDGTTYNVRMVKKKYDGDTYVATLELPE